MVLAAATSKGIATHDAIIEHAIAMVRKDGLESLSIGGLAEASAMSKSGVFAHFGSREDLQLAVLDAVAEDFAQTVLAPACLHPRGLQRLRALIANCIAWSRQGCPMIAAAIEYDDRPGVIRDRVVHWQRRLRETLARAVKLALDAGELRAGTDPEQVAFELFGVVLVLHHDAHLFDAAAAQKRATHAFERLLAHYTK